MFKFYVYIGSQIKRTLSIDDKVLSLWLLLFASG